MKVLVLVARGLQAAYLGCYGNQWIATPALDGLAAQSVVLDQHYADCPNDDAVPRVWRRGRFCYPSGAGTDDNPPFQSPDMVTLLSANNIPAVLLSAGPRAMPGDFELGWTEVVRGTSSTKDDPDSLWKAAQAAIARVRGHSHWLLWIDSLTLLPPWEIPRGFRDLYFDAGNGDLQDAEVGEETDEAGNALVAWRGPLPERIESSDDVLFERLRRSYAGAVSLLDEMIGRLLGYLEKRKLFEEALIIFTADRGIPLGEHGDAGEFACELHEELIHLPMIVRLHGRAEAGRRIAALTQPVDLLPTILDAFDLPIPPIHGSSLLPLCRGESARIRSYACSGMRVRDSNAWSLRTPRWVLLLSPEKPGVVKTSRLYGKPDDRWEVNDLFQHHQDLAQHLEDTLRAFVDAARRPGPLEPPEIREIEGEPSH
jgi:hypothetical protein